MGRDGGQASVEWVGLLLLAALALGAVAAVRAPARDRDLGASLAGRLSCAAAGEACPTLEHRRTTAAPPGRSPAARQGRSADPAAPSLVLPRPAGAASPPTARSRAAPLAVNAFRRLRSLGALTRRLWIVCLGYRRYLYERDHVLSPTRAMPLEEALDVANACLNPLSFAATG